MSCCSVLSCAMLYWVQVNVTIPWKEGDACGFIQVRWTGRNSGGRFSLYCFTLRKQDKGSTIPFQFCANFASHTNWLAFRFWGSCWFSLINLQQVHDLLQEYLYRSEKKVPAAVLQFCSWRSEKVREKRQCIVWLECMIWKLWKFLTILWFLCLQRGNPLIQSVEETHSVFNRWAPHLCMYNALNMKAFSISCFTFLHLWVSSCTVLMHTLSQLSDSRGSMLCLGMIQRAYISQTIYTVIQSLLRTVWMA